MISKWREIVNRTCHEARGQGIVPGMPSHVTHILAGESSLEALPDGAGTSILETCGSWFRLGCQGPDIFYHNQRTRPSGLHFGSLAHRHGYGKMLEGIVAHMLRTRSGDAVGDADRDRDADSVGDADGTIPVDPASAWLYGLASHAAVDRALHPYIVCKSGWVVPGAPEQDGFRHCHPFLERLLDVYILERVRGIGIRDYPAAALMRIGQEGQDNEEEREALADLWTQGLVAAYPLSVARDRALRTRILNAMADTERFFELTDPSRPPGRFAAVVRAMRKPLQDERSLGYAALVHPDTLPPDIDIANESGKSWPHPSGDGEWSTENVRDLFARGVETGSRYMLAAAKAIRGQGSPGSLGSLVGDGGLGVVDSTGRSTAPRIMDPLPVRRMLREHRDLLFDMAQP